MKYTLMELSLFEQHRDTYFDDEQFRVFQNFLAANPESGNTVAGTGGLRKIRWADPGRGKGSEAVRARFTSCTTPSARYGCLPSTTKTWLKI